jgi:hypothetical protein
VGSAEVVCVDVDVELEEIVGENAEVGDEDDPADIEEYGIHRVLMIVTLGKGHDDVLASTPAARPPLPEITVTAAIPPVTAGLSVAPGRLCPGSTHGFST